MIVREKKAEKALKTIFIENTRFPEWIEKLIKVPTQGVDHNIWSKLNARDVCKGKALLDEDAKSASMLDDPHFIWKYQQRMLESLLSGMIDHMKKEEKNG